MKKLIKVLILSILTYFLLFNIELLGQKKPDDILGKGYDFENNGKDHLTNPLRSVFTVDTSNLNISFAEQDQLDKALKSNLSYLKRIRKNRKYFQSIGGKTIPYSDLIKVNEQLQTQKTNLLNLNDFSLFKLWGEDTLGNVHYTSYYIPILEVSEQKDSIYKYPIYKKPSSKYEQGLSRSQIDVEGKLNGKNLELAYAKNYFDYHSMQVQGSGYVKYQDGRQFLFSYGGKNGRSYTSIGRYLADQGQIKPEDLSLYNLREWFIKHPDSTHIFMKNESYVFFQKSTKLPSGAAGIPLIDNVSVAADLKYLPKGALLLAKVPVLNNLGALIRHEYRIIMVHDTGGAIKGPGHIDLYAGVGEKAEQLANAMHHYGSMWLILPK